MNRVYTLVRGARVTIATFFAPVLAVERCDLNLSALDAGQDSITLVGGGVRAQDLSGNALRQSKLAPPFLMIGSVRREPGGQARLFPSGHASFRVIGSIGGVALVLRLLGLDEIAVGISGGPPDLPLQFVVAPGSGERSHQVSEATLLKIGDSSEDVLKLNQTFLVFFPDNVKIIGV